MTSDILRKSVLDKVNRTCCLSAVGSKSASWTLTRVVARTADARGPVLTHVVDAKVRRRITLATRISKP